MRRALPAPALWIAVLLVALLPWRAWAWATMHAPSPPATTWLAPSAHTPAQAPCHAEPARSGDAAATPENPSSPQACSHCDLCHAGLAPLPQPELATQFRPEAPSVAVRLGLDRGRIDTPFRPPR